MAQIVKRNNSYRAIISLYKNGKYKRESKSFKDKKEAKLWAQDMELSKGRGKDIAIRSTLFTVL